MRQNISKLSSYSGARAKHITSLRREKGYMPRAIESASDIIREQRSKRRDYYLIIKLRITFNGDKLHRYD